MWRLPRTTAARGGAAPGQPQHGHHEMASVASTSNGIRSTFLLSFDFLRSKQGRRNSGTRERAARGRAAWARAGERPHCNTSRGSGLDPLT